VNPALRCSAAHVFVRSLVAPQLDDADEHHLLRVLRVREGEVVTVSDGIGGWRVTHLVGHSLVPVGEPMSEPEPPQLTVACAIPKGDRAEWMVQKLTEIGVKEIVPMHCARSTVRWEGERGQRQLERSRRVAREAAMQSRRVWLPVIAAAEGFDSIVRRPGIVLAEPGGRPPAALDAPPALVVVGPEGGFTPGELAVDAPRVGLGRNVLRIETAAIAAAVLFLVKPV
jgi:16S rRNA (uracil1498-N3)-methyltransferase